MAQRKDARRNREEIIAAAKRVFAQHGVNAPISMIYEEAQVGRATFYRNFNSRNDLIHGIYLYQLEQLEELANEDKDDGLRRVIEGYIHFVAQSPNLLSVFVMGPEHFGTLESMRHRYFTFLDGVLQQSIEKGDVPKKTTIEDLNMLLAMVQGVILLRDNPNTKSRTRFALEVVDSYFGWGNHSDEKPKGQPRE